MKVPASGNYPSHRDWFREVLKGQDVILSHTSALECLNLFVGYVNEILIEVYAKEAGPYENIKYNIVDTFDNLDIIEENGLRYTSLDQTINDMLRDYHTMDDSSLAQALADYYYEHSQSFEGINVEPQYEDNRWAYIKEWAKEFYSWGPSTLNPADYNL